MRGQMTSYLLALLTFLQIVSSLKGEDVSLISLPAYQAARPCLQNCLNGGVGCGGACGIHYGDPLQAATCSQNYCLCRPDLQETIYSALTACMDNSCKNPLELSSIVSIFSGYCGAYYATAPPYPTLPTSSSIPVITSTPADETTESTSAPPTSQLPPTVTQTLITQSTVVVYRSSSTTSFSNSEWAQIYLSRIGALVAMILTLQ